MKDKRKKINETINNMFLSDTYKDKTLFYAHMLAQVKIVIQDIPAPAGVSFKTDHYKLYINYEKFNEYSLNDRVFIIIHEMLHILMGHLTFRDSLKGHNGNLATDCAINQLVQLDIPKDAIMPNNLHIKGEVLKKKDAEYYYSLLKSSSDDSENSSSNSENSDSSDDSENSSENSKNSDSSGNSSDNSDSSGNSSENSDSSVNNSGNSSSKIKALDTHELWNSEAPKELIQDVTKRMIEQSIDETIKQKGNLPQNISDILDLFTDKSQVNWKKVLKNLIGNKRIGKKFTIKRKPRRFHGRDDLKGTVKDRTFDLVCLIDISGSMNNHEILQGLNEVHYICKRNNTKMKILQIDSEVKEDSLQEFSSKTKIFERKGCGGTYLGSGIKYLLDNKVPFDGLLVITDGYCENISQDGYWTKVNKKVIWLVTSDNHIPGIENMRKHIECKLTLNSKLD